MLALLADPTPMQALLEQLRATGICVDTADDLQAARSRFFGAGGHDCVVFAPDVQPGLVQRVVASLAALDPGVAVATFGPDPGRQRPARTAHLAGFHPGSRAGQGALLRFLRGL